MNDPFKVLGVIPARGGSKGVPRKNIKPLAGRPLLHYTATAARQSTLLSQTVVSTEDSEIAACARSVDLPVVHRPANLAQDTTPTLPVVQHVLDQLEPEHGRFDAVFVLQVTSPFRTASDIDAAIRLLRSSGAESVLGVVRIFDAHPIRVKRIIDGRLVDYAESEDERMPRQKLPPAYLRNGAVYLTRRDIVDAGTLRGTDQCPYEMPPERSINIDEPLDFLWAETLLNARPELFVAEPSG